MNISHWAAIAVVAAIAYVKVVRPWHLTLGCTPAEATGELPGDELLPRACFVGTHAITIGAPPSAVWPWVVQIGQGRAGFYSHEWLEQLFGLEIANVYRIVPELQDLEVGDDITLHVKAPAMTVFQLEPARHLVLGGGWALQPEMKRDPSWFMFHTYTGYTWSFILREQPDGTTRFIARIRCGWNADLIGHLFRSRMFLEPVHTIMQTGMNAGLKRCVEREAQAQSTRA